MISSVRNSTPAAEQTQSAAAQNPAVYETPFGDVLASQITGIDLDAWVTGGNSSVASAASTRRQGPGGAPHHRYREANPHRKRRRHGYGQRQHRHRHYRRQFERVHFQWDYLHHVRRQRQRRSHGGIGIRHRDPLAERPHRFGQWRLLELQPDLLCHRNRRRKPWLKYWAARWWRRTTSPARRVRPCSRASRTRWCSSPTAPRSTPDSWPTYTITATRKATSIRSLPRLSSRESVRHDPSSLQRRQRHERPAAQCR